MEENLVEVFTADKQYKINLIKELLEENEIECFVLNQKGSALLLGEIQIYVDKADEKKAREIIQSHEI
jgi:hypothetical protein